MIAWLIDGLPGFLTAWLIAWHDCLVDCLIGWCIGWLLAKLINCLIAWLIQCLDSWLYDWCVVGWLDCWLVACIDVTACLPDWFNQSHGCLIAIHALLLVIYTWLLDCLSAWWLDCMSAWLHDCMSGWLVTWFNQLIDLLILSNQWLIDWLIEWLCNCMIAWLHDWSSAPQLNSMSNAFAEAWHMAPPRQGSVLALGILCNPRPQCIGNQLSGLLRQRERASSITAAQVPTNASNSTSSAFAEAWHMASTKAMRQCWQSCNFTNPRISCIRIGMSGMSRQRDRASSLTELKCKLAQLNELCLCWGLAHCTS